MEWFAKFVGITSVVIVVTAVCVLLQATAVMVMWNWVMPSVVSGAQTITVFDGLLLSALSYFLTAPLWVGLAQVRWKLDRNSET